MELDEQGYPKEYPVFTAKPVEKIDNGEGRWNYQIIGVFQQDAKDEEPKQIGEYKRNYSSFYNTFSATRKGDKFYALYSPDYTCTRVLEITPNEGIKDIGGEEPNGDGFCPVDLYVPTIRCYVSQDDYGIPPHNKDWNRLLDYFPPGTRVDGKFSKSKSSQRVLYPDGKEIRFYTGKEAHGRPDYLRLWTPMQDKEYGFVILPPIHAFVAGCYWGDDTTWKIQYIDVSRIDEGIIKRDDRFGYINLPSRMTLKDAISLRDYDEQPTRLRIAIEVDYDISGGLIDWDGLKKQIDLGEPIIKAQEDGNKKWRDSYDDLTAELKARWETEGKQITDSVLDAGGMLR